MFSELGLALDEFFVKLGFVVFVFEECVHFGDYGVGLRLGDLVDLLGGKSASRG